jgi:hypothetical protein
VPPLGYFPFGGPVLRIEQQDRAPKAVFVLGVYASAVHARWVDANDNELVVALAVASEPCIFWRGEDAQSIIAKIVVPQGAGRLKPPKSDLNGPSGRALDDRFLRPLGFARSDAWLCDLVPHSCVNGTQQAAIERVYMQRIGTHGLPRPSVPRLPELLTTDARRQEIAHELMESQAQLLILLGDQPVRWFLRSYDDRWSTLGDFQRNGGRYGERHSVVIEGRRLDVLPLVHPRQAARLGRCSPTWYGEHARWMQKQERRRA